MDTNETAVTDAVTTDLTPAAGAPTPEVESSGVELTASDSETDEKVTPAGPAYVPDYKLRVYEQDAVLEDPFLKALIKDADSEKKVKEIAQKYMGFDTIKEKHEKAKGEHQTYQQQTQPILNVYNEYSKFAKAGDLDSIFQLLKIPEQAIFQYAVAKAEEAQLDPTQRYQIQQQRQIARDKMQLDEQNQSLQSQMSTQLSQHRNQELNWVMARPEVHSVAQVYDAKVGPGSFRQLVIDKGLAHHAATRGQEDLSAEQAAMEVLKYIGAFVTPTSSGMPQPGQAPNVALIQQNGAPPIIPNVSGRGTSPVSKKILSLNGLRKKAEELSASSS